MASGTAAAPKAGTETHEVYRQIFENANDAIYLFELDERGLPGRILEVNDLACKRLGYTREEYLAMDPAQMDAPETEVDIPESMDHLRERGHETIELIHLARDGTRIPVEVSSHLFHVGGKTRHLAIVRDIRERKRAEERLRASLREKEVLLREIHHRVKNNLQLVSSLISLHDYELTDKTLTELQTRVRAMALVHEVLYGMQDLSHIRFDDYLRALIAELQEVYDNGDTTVSLSLAEVSIPMETASPLGLLVTEIVSNAFKHAHPDGGAGRLWVTLTEGPPPVVHIADDGVGLPEQPPQKRTSLGMTLIEELSDQLRAELDVSRQGGTGYTIRLPEDHHESLRSSTRSDHDNFFNRSR
ncbi:MAG: sensor histidine kinase [Spirochaetaceae bacterium]